MTTADWALILSILSFFVALAGFVWNVWSKFIYPRAKVRAHVAVMLVIDGNGSPARRTIALSATNYGPTDITLRSHQAKRRQGFLWFRRNRHLAFINPIAHPDSEVPTGWFAPGFPKKLAVGEGVTVYFSAGAPKRWVEKADLYYFGFSDTFGRLHWCSRSNARKFRKDVIENFGAAAPKKPSLLKRARTAAAASRTRCFEHLTSACARLACKLRRKP
ncbi:MAG: hypothetical protein AB7F35_15570 [Acetobacteraceae bacterium]